jgi:hypothetical protein
MTEPLDVGHLRALLRSFSFVGHERPMKLTTKDAKDTKKMPPGK